MGQGAGELEQVEKPRRKRDKQAHAVPGGQDLSRAGASLAGGGGGAARKRGGCRCRGSSLVYQGEGILVALKVGGKGMVWVTADLKTVVRNVRGE